MNNQHYSDMGSGKELICKKCGTKWLHFTGVGMSSTPEEIQQEAEHPGTVNNTDPVCPECGSTEYDETGTSLLFD